jgi:hypothetical protein
VALGSWDQPNKITSNSTRTLLAMKFTYLSENFIPIRGMINMVAIPEHLIQKHLGMGTCLVLVIHEQKELVTIRQKVVMKVLDAIVCHLLRNCLGTQMNSRHNIHHSFEELAVLDQQLLRFMCICKYLIDVLPIWVSNRADFHFDAVGEVSFIADGSANKFPTQGMQTTICLDGMSCVKSLSFLNP